MTARQVPAQPESEASAETVAMGDALYSGYCKICHGSEAVARFSGSVPDLRYSTSATFETWDAIVVDGSRAAGGMPAVGVTEEQSQAIRSYERALELGGPFDASIRTELQAVRRRNAGRRIE